MDWLNENLGTEATDLSLWARLALIAGIIIAAYLVDILFKYAITPIVHKITAKTETEWDDILLSDKVCASLSAIIPPVLLATALPFVLRGMLEVIVGKITLIYIAFNVCRFFTVLMRAIYDIFIYENHTKAHSLQGLLQTFQIIVWIIGIILMVSILIEKSPVFLFTGLGASAAVLMLVFQDSIKGLVAGIQLTLNDMVRVGDWITMPARGVNGEVFEITLSTVKVRNFDNTVLTILPYSLLTDTFQNWRGMKESDGRRLTRTINIDLHSIQFLDAKQVARYQQQGMLPDSAQPNVATNLEAFRGAMVQRMRQMPEINPEMTLMVRHLPATPEGIPVELYAFTRTKVWEEYEEIQARLIEMMVALMPKFGILPYQRSSDKRSCPDNK